MVEKMGATLVSFIAVRKQPEVKFFPENPAGECLALKQLSLAW